MTIESSQGTQTEQALLNKVPKGLFIAGEWREAAGGATFAVEDPSTGAVLAHVADASAADGTLALDAARAAQASWAATPPRERSDILDRAYHDVLDRLEEFALVITLEMGKPLAESRGEVRYAADFLRWFSEQAVRIRGDYRVSPDGQSRLLTLRQPVGPSLLISPWNFPLAMITRKVAPALAAGCTAVLKPAEDTPLTCQLLTQVLSDAGVPSGVLSVLPTSDPAGLVAPMLADQRLRKVSFTGSTAVGQQLLVGAAQNVLRTSMELGGNSAFLVFDDADLEAAVEGALVAKLRNGGESCVAANRILVQSGVAEEFSQQLADRIGQVSVGRGTEPGTQLGPMINRQQRDRVQLLVDDAVRSGATVVTGGSAPDSAGYFYEPTVITGVSASARITHEEVFGPVAPVYTFDTEDEAVRVANDTPFGLVSYAYTRDVGRALRVAEALEAGMVGVNRGLVSNAAAPFGGVKQSGLGREGGFEGIEEYLSVKYVAMDKP